MDPSKRDCEVGKAGLGIAKRARVIAAILLLASLALSPGRYVDARQGVPTTTPEPQPQRGFDPTHIKLEAGYKIEPVISNLSVPTTAIFDGNDLLLVESGWANTALPRVLRIKPDWTVEELAVEGLKGPVTGLLVKDGKVYVSHAGKVSVIESGKLRDIVTGLPSDGDHQNNNIVLGPDGKIYMGQGTVTNSGVVGVDSYIFGWLDKHPEVHEIPCKDITLVGENFETDDPLNQGKKATTGAYKPFGTPSMPGEVIKGDVKCGGSIVRFNPDGTGFELVAWGLRNPFGLEFDAQGQLWSAYHGADVRGSRAIKDDPDYFVDVKEGAWYGWPDFFAGEPVDADRFKDPLKPKPHSIWKDHPPLAKPFAVFETHAGANGVAFSPGGEFGFQGDAFVAMFGSYLPVTTGLNVKPNGFQVARVDMKTKEVHDFASNNVPGPAYINQTKGFDRPSDVVFAPDNSMYVVDWGASTVTDEGLKLTPLTGVVWRIYKDSGKQVRPQGALVVKAPPQIPEEQRKTEVRNSPETWKELMPTLLVLGAIVVLSIGILVWLWKVMRGRKAKA
jgi:glucose/arabinose dehydrogenase